MGAACASKHQTVSVVIENADRSSNPHQNQITTVQPTSPQLLTVESANGWKPEHSSSLTSEITAVIHDNHELSTITETQSVMIQTPEPESPLTMKPSETFSSPPPMPSILLATTANVGSNVSVGSRMTTPVPPPDGNKRKTIHQILATYDSNFAKLLTGKSLSDQELLFKLKEFNIFLVSNSDDITEERKILNNEVFPVLRQSCLSKGYEFNLVDIPAILSKEINDVFIRERHYLQLLEQAVKTSTSAIVIILLTNKLGPRTLPTTLNPATFNTFKSHLDDQLTRLLSELYQQWPQEGHDGSYHLTAPSVALTSGEGTSWPTGVRDILNSLLREENVRELATETFKSALYNEISWILNNRQLTTFAISRHFTASTIVEEADTNLLGLYFDNLPNSTLTETNTDGDVDKIKPLEVADTALDLVELNNRITAEISMDKVIHEKLKWTLGVGLSVATPEHEEYLDTIRTRLLDFLTTEIRDKMNSRDVNEFVPPLNKLEKNIVQEILTNLISPPNLTPDTIQHCTSPTNAQTYPTEETKTFFRDNLLDRSENYVIDESSSDFPRKLLITGVSGSGRTTALQWLVGEVNARPDHVVVCRTINRSILSSFGEGLVTSLLEQLCCLLQHHVDNTFSETAEQLRHKLEYLLSLWPEDKIFLLIIDDIDLIGDFETIVFLELIQLPPSCWMIVTGKEDYQFKTLESHKHVRLSLVKPTYNSFNEFPKLAPPCDYQTSLTINALKEARKLTNTSTSESESVVKIFSDVISQIEAIFDPSLMQQVCCPLISSSRLSGIIKTALVSIVSNLDKSEVSKSIMATKISLILNFLSPFLIQRRDINSARIYRFRSDDITKLFDDRYQHNDQLLFNYLCENITQTFCLQYFSVLTSQCSEGFYNKLDVNLLVVIFSNVHPSILAYNGKKKFRNGEPADETFDAIAEVIRSNKSILWYSPETFILLLFDQYKSKFKLKGVHKTKLEKVMKSVTTDVTRGIYLNPLKGSPVFSDEDENHVNAVFPLPVDYWPGHVITLSSLHSCIIVWNLIDGKRVREWRNVPAPKDLRCISSTLVLVRCDRELRIYDLDAGRLIRCLKGVLNLKMPFFELMNSETMVALSRNRMYVEMTNIESGEMQTTFKVGEDRFLNSLLVSANGQYCVCGDETTKPFPLLVWDLFQRKLIHDIRIAGHHFDTSKAEITADGNYVISVAKELEDPAPNFLLIYDLTSGQLFRKLKPAFNTTCVAIHKTASFVVNGLESGVVQVWDICAGSLSQSLEGHTFPPTKLELSPTNICLSVDETGNDRGIRLWNIDTGDIIGVYVSPCNFTCCCLIQQDLGIVVGLRGCGDIVTVLFNKDSKLITDKEQSFGDPERNGLQAEIQAD